jgi:hypothetical protein
MPVKNRYPVTLELFDKAKVAGFRVKPGMTKKTNPKFCDRFYHIFLVNMQACVEQKLSGSSLVGGHCSGITSHSDVRCVTVIHTQILHRRGLIRICLHVSEDAGFAFLFRPLPCPFSYFGHVLAVFCYVFPVVYQFVPDGLLCICGNISELRHTVYHI